MMYIIRFFECHIQKFRLKQDAKRDPIFLSKNKPRIVNLITNTFSSSSTCLIFINSS